jgi:hypothetical protein
MHGMNNTKETDNSAVMHFMKPVSLYSSYLGKDVWRDGLRQRFYYALRWNAYASKKLTTTVEEIMEMTARTR